MATIATPYTPRPGADSWEIPEAKPWLVRVARPWLKNPVGLGGLLLVLAFFILGASQSPWLDPYVGEHITPQNPTALNAPERNLGPSLEHPFGTTPFGQDVLSRVIEGAWNSLRFSVLVMLFGFVPGTALGILSGYAGRWADYAIQRSGEIWSAIPQLPLLLAVIAAVGQGLNAVIIVLAISAIFGGSRLMRVVALLEKNKEYVLAARSTGASETRLLFFHVLPNVMPYVLVGASSVFAVAILAEATLSFLGLGLQQDEVGWGLDLSKGLDNGTEYPHLVIFPGLAISIVVLGFNLMGDTLRDILDPRLRGSQ